MIHSWVSGLVLKKDKEQNVSLVLTYTKQDRT